MRCNAWRQLSIVVGMVIGISLWAAVDIARAEVIRSPVSVINVVPNFPGCCEIERTIDHSGLLTDFISGVTDYDTYIAGGPLHSLEFSGEWFAPIGDFGPQPIDYDLGASYLISRMAFWNEDAWGTTSVSVFTSNDPLFVVSTFVGLFAPTNHPIVNYPPDNFDLFDSSARYVRLLVTGTPGDDGDGFSNEAVSIGEVAFRTADVDVEVIPEPTTLLLFATGLAGFGARRRRKKESII